MWSVTVGHHGKAPLTWNHMCQTIINEVTVETQLNVAVNYWWSRVHDLLHTLVSFAIIYSQYSCCQYFGHFLFKIKKLYWAKGLWKPSAVYVLLRLFCCRFIFVIFKVFYFIHISTMFFLWWGLNNLLKLIEVLYIIKITVLIFF